MLLESLPVPGSSGLVAVAFPFGGEVGESFWTLFQPPLSLVNGLSEYPDEIAQCGLVEAELVSVVDAGGVVEARVLEVIGLADLADHFPASPPPPELPCIDFPRVWRTDCGDLTLLEGMLESDVGGWMLLQGDALVVYGEWGFHESFIHAGHVECSPEQVRYLGSVAQGS